MRVKSKRKEFGGGESKEEDGNLSRDRLRIRDRSISFPF